MSEHHIRHPRPPRICEQCGATYECPRWENPGAWAARRYCGQRCSAAAARVRRAEGRRDPNDIIEDVEWIIGTDQPINVAARVGLTLDGLRDVLNRQGRTDLADRLRLRESA